MASRPEFVAYLCEQLEGTGTVRARKMFGEYLIYVNDKPALLVCDDTPFVKMLPCVAELLGRRPTAAPYEGAKEHYVLDPDDRDTLRQAVALVSEYGPLPQRRSRKKGEKFHFLPQAENDHLFIPLPLTGEGEPETAPEPELAPAAEPSPEPEPAGKYPCPCCGFLTFPVPREEAIAYICPVCFWENDVFDPGEDAPSDENRGMTLCQGRENFHRWGAVRRDLVQYARKPTREEMGQSIPGDGKGCSD